MREIHLANGRGVALVDDADYERVAQHRWFLTNGYATRSGPRVNGRRKTEYMHTFLLGHRPGYTVDHKNRVKLDNRRENLRWATYSVQNSNRTVRGTSRYRGVVWRKRNKKWEAYAQKDGKNAYLGQYAREEDAARAYDRKAIELYGSQAALNFPEEWR
jgi:hypothetical protein